MNKFQSNGNVVYYCKYHEVLCPKYRRAVLKNGVDTRLKEIITQLAKEMLVDILEMEVMPDHIHLLIEVESQFGIHKAIKRFKVTSSRLLRQEEPHLKSKLPTLWTSSYFVSTVVGAPLEVVKRYIQLQKEV